MLRVTIPTKKGTFVYPRRRLGISSRISVYIIAVSAYHHRRCISLRLDDIQPRWLMICNSYGIGDIHGFAVIL